jgi:hypothetical protein
MSPDRQSLSLLFNDYISKAGPANGRAQETRICQVHVPIVISNGWYQTMITRVDFRGVASLPANAHLNVTGSYSVSSPIHPTHRPQSFSVNSSNLVGPTIEDYMFSVVPIEDGSLIPRGPETSWSVCSNQIELKINSRLNLVNRTMVADALASIDSIDATVNPGIEYQVKWRRCR